MPEPSDPYQDPSPGRAAVFRRGPGRLGIAIVAGGAALGAIVSVAVHTAPGNLLGAFVIAATLAAALAVRRDAVYRVIPAPALAYAVAALLTGLVHDRGIDTSRTALAVNAGQWIASGFLTMAAATFLAVAMTAVRWPRRGRVASAAAGPPHSSAGPPPEAMPGPGTPGVAWGGREGMSRPHR
jgi:hypothetical protein